MTIIVFARVGCSHLPPFADFTRKDGKPIESDMCNLQIYVQCHDRFFEVLPDEVENAELTVEDIVSHILLDLFGEVTVDDVTIRFSPGLRMGLHHCTIQIHAQCSYQSFALLPCTKANMVFAVEKRLCSILKELFGSVKVDSVMLSLFPWDQENDSAPLLRT